MALAKNSSIKTSKEIAAISEKIRDSKLKFSDLIIPIIVFTILGFLTVFVFVPMINSALEAQREIKETDRKIDELEKLESTLDSLDENKLSDDVILSKSVIPKILKVSDFIYYVDTLAKEKSLFVRELSAGDMGGAAKDMDSSGAGVSGPISYLGDYENVVSFLEQVQSISPYIIRIQNVEIAALDTGQWTISLSVSGYYMAENTDNVDIYKPFKVYTDYQGTLDIFEEKAKNL